MNHLITLMNHLPEQFDAALITSGVNRRYYTGFSSSAGTLVVTRKQSYFIVDSRYYEVASEKISGCKVILQGKLHEQVAQLLENHGAQTIGIETDTITFADFLTLQDKLGEFTISEDGALSAQINAQREIKSQEEINFIQLAQDNTDKTFTHILSFIKPGMTEIEIALEMEFYSRQNGSEEPAFSFIVAGGKNSSRPHAVPSNYILQNGDFLTMDFGSTVNGYRSDMTRTIAIGHVSDKQKEVYELVLKAHLDAMVAVKAGVDCHDIDAIARNIIDATEYKGLFGHGLGHSIGLDVHENPRFALNFHAESKAGHIMSVEPGIYIPGEFGVRIEDIVAVTETGYYNFAHSPKELIIL